MPAEKKYPGIHNAPQGAMNTTGNIIRDAWIFGLIPETETCEGWTVQRVDALYEQVSKAWEPFGHMVSQLPRELAEKHRRVYGDAVKTARNKGWDPELGEND